MTATQQTAAQRYEYEQATDISRVGWLSEQGWRLHSAVPCGGNVLFFMERPTVPDHGQAELVERVRRARALHAPVRSSSADKQVCRCDQFTWPCETVRALDGGAS